MTFDDIVSPRTLFNSILNDEIVKAAYKQCKSQPVKCANEILPRHPLWYTRRTGIQNLFAGLRLPNVQTKDDGYVKHYTSSTRERNGSRYTLEWAEQRGNHIMVVSRLETRLPHREAPKRKAVNADYGMRHEISQRMKEVQRGILRGKHLNRVFYVVGIKDTPEETIWYLARRVLQSMRTFKSPLTLTEKAREQWKVEQEKYAEKQQYKWKHLTPESSKNR
ncbi:uncharacterized protein NECHADRAFT_76770 [Fusarium vanettenii 77-13-4]|uniref:Uncharacterized protein n=1 Tax=Fusarium vanettenii (strain ATCC MYA-4622 / CBS 123669 / FGSC 9596 / NRRL 45880 / 77-13-4) TaxID=660122 RepID=C7Z575_FUSV7|nr:uncharacterized protein NECHADRAFT_76770 [Fusarium vanettenii 77-13-4]EEU40472.1 predicted protein [Fusarium vanettenii 77-13-4]